MCIVKQLVIIELDIIVAELNTFAKLRQIITSKDFLGKTSSAYKAVSSFCMYYLIDNLLRVSSGKTVRYKVNYYN